MRQRPLYLEGAVDEKMMRIVGFDTAEEQHECVLLNADGLEELHLKCRNCGAVHGAMMPQELMTCGMTPSRPPCEAKLPSSGVIIGLRSEM